MNQTTGIESDVLRGTPLWNEDEYSEMELGEMDGRRNQSGGGL